MYLLNDVLQALRQRRIFLYFLILSSLSFVAMATVYDFLTDTQACVICQTQRVILVCMAISSAVSLRFHIEKFVMFWPIVGLILSARHIYVLAFPQQITQCLPFDILVYLPYSYMFDAIMNKLSTLGHECAVNVSLMTYVFVVFLIVYYTFSLFLHKRR